MKRVLIIMGSKSDMEYAKLTEKVLQRLGLEFDTKILSAHRNIDELYDFVTTEVESYAVIICMAGYAAHLAGVVAAMTERPVIAVPLAQSELQGLESILSTVMMPKGAPIAVMSLGKSGAINAAIYAAKILSLSDERVYRKVKEVKSDLSALWK